MARVSIIIPTYNRAALAARAVRSALAQTVPGCEVIVVDDGSTDETPQVLATFGDAVHVLRQANAGVGHARNAGIGVATGERLLFLDSDDQLDPEAVARLGALLDAAPHAGMAYGQARVVDDAGAELPTRRPLYAHPEGVWPGVRELEHLLCRNYLATDAILLPRAVWDRTGGFDPSCGSMGEDWDLWVRIARAFDVGYVAAPVVTVQSHRASLSSSATERMRAEAARTYRHIIEDAFADPAVGPTLAPQRTRIEAFYHFNLGELAYAGHDVATARAELRQAVRLDRRLLRDPELPGARTLWLKSRLPTLLTEAARARKHASDDA